MISKSREYRREYNRLYMKTKYLKYLGVTICSNCGLKGYASLMYQQNIKTGVSTKPYLMIIHQHTNENHKTVHDRTCYGGLVKS